MSSLSNAIARLDGQQLARLRYALSNAGFGNVATAIAREHAELQNADHVGGEDAPEDVPEEVVPPEDAPSGTGSGGMAYSDPNAPHPGPMAYSSPGLNLFVPK